MAQLDEVHKRCIVELLATYHRPTQIIAILKEAFGVEATRQQIDAYQPGKYNCRISDELKAHYQATRDAFNAERDTIAISQRNYRQRVRDEMVSAMLDLPLTKQNHPFILQVLEQSAKEDGGVFRKDLGASDEEVAAYVAQMAARFKAAVIKNVTHPEQAAAVIQEIETELEAGGEEGSP